MQDLVSQPPEIAHYIARALDNGPGFAAVKLEESEADLLLSGGQNPSSEPENAPKIASSAPDTSIAGTENRSQTPEEGENDRDYVPEESDDAPIPVTFGALKSASKKRPNPFAPPERDPKKRKISLLRYLNLLKRDDNREKRVKH